MTQGAKARKSYELTVQSSSPLCSGAEDLVGGWRTGDVTACSSRFQCLQPLSSLLTGSAELRETFL